MSERYDDKNSAEIQRDIDHTRAEMSETLDTLRGRLSPGELLDQAVAYVKAGGASEYTRNLGETVKQNPVPTVLIGIGLAWLMMGGSRGHQPAASTPGTSGLGRRAREAAGHMAERAGSTVQGARAGAGGAQARAGEMAQGARQQAGETADRMWSQAASQGDRAKASFTYLQKEQPLVLGALGFALGAALGAGLPSTEREDELMGETRDAYVHRAKEMGEEQLERAREVATAAGRAAQEQLHHEGVTSEQVDEQGRQVAEGAERVVQASRQAAEHQARRQDSASP